ncbi:Nramp family divalent metal transporter [Aureisphaera sp. CAU 1614]|uniref:Nramp family divalent metal transporter n=1 Tax=Halomarinibacterium sedimenti TaxID=2857106 RepID=A0A9X1FLE3_9FLAO|nr:Nramp family divalent metal transporter [Halomarinibacterium sedimenti]MBW2936594.1 Nramp family divalent metal transporter [Halomarinibacterium sedimenti]
MTQFLKKFGPGFLFAGAAIGVSHLVQSTRAGADFGLGLLWALVLINVIKYPFFQFGPRYASATGENLLQGYAKMSRWVLVAYFIITFATMFTIQTAVTIVTAGIASSLFASGTLVFWTTAVTSGCFFILLLGKYKVLDSLMKYIVVVLAISTIAAVILASTNFEGGLSFQQLIPKDTMGIAFLIAFMGWMPAPLDITIWQSIWTIEKQKLNSKVSFKDSLFDFNVGYVMTIILGICFIALGTFVMFGSGESFSAKGDVFANQLIGMYTISLGSWAQWIIGIAALATMFSTTLTTLDASPRVMHITSELLFKKTFKQGYLFWLLILIAGTLSIFFFFVTEMGLLIEIATVLSFLTAPFYAIISYILITGKYTPKEARPSGSLRLFSLLGIFILVGFSIWYLVT